MVSSVKVFYHRNVYKSCGGFEDYIIDDWWRGINDSSDFFKFIDKEAITDQVDDSFTFDEKAMA